MTNPSPANAEQTDKAQYYQARDTNPRDLLLYAAAKSGRSVLQVNRDFRKMTKPPSQLTLVEYVRNGLFHPDRYSDDERARFISNELHWPITHCCCDAGWQAAAEDKILAGTILAAGGVPVPETLAVIDASQRLYPGAEKIATAAELRGFLGRHADTPLFGKIVAGMVSFGAFRLERADTERIHCTGREPVGYDDFLGEIVGTNAYMMQRALDNHPALAPYCTGLATVRMVNLLTDQGVRVPAAVIKLPISGNIADAFWRPGNLACDIEVETGRLRTVARRGVETEFLDDHPDRPGLMGLQLPFWDELRAINDRAARLFAPLRYQSTDIAITPEGPIVVELNYGGGFDLPQYASGRGLLTPEFRAFVESCGFDLAAPRSKKRFGLWRR